MYTQSALVALVASLSAVSAAVNGFNYGSTDSGGNAVSQQGFVTLFNAAKQIAGSSFTSARLYTMIQGKTTSDLISAVSAADATGTSLLLGMWASQDQNGFNNEITALKAAIKQFPKLKVDGLSVGSEDLYRITPTGIASAAGTGQDPTTLTNYINQVKTIVHGSAWGNVPVGHVDTWTAWVNGSNSGVIGASDFLGVDAYPYFQNTMANSIDNGQALFQQALGNTQGVASGKPVWITETGWPVSGKTENQAEASAKNAKAYWDSVGCLYFGTTNTWWYTLDDSVGGATPSPSFGLSADLKTSLYDLSCMGVSNSSSSTTAVAATATTAGLSASLAGASAIASGMAFSTAGSGPIVTGAPYGGNGSSNGTSGSGSGSGTGSGSRPTPTSTKASGSSPSSTALSTGGAAAVRGSVLTVAAAIAAALAFL